MILDLQIETVYTLATWQDQLTKQIPAIFCQQCELCCFKLGNTSGSDFAYCGVAVLFLLL